MPASKSNYDTASKLAAGKLSEVQNSVLTDYPITVIEGSISINRLDIRVDLTTVDVNQKFINMDIADS